MTIIFKNTMDSLDMREVRHQVMTMVSRSGPLSLIFLQQAIHKPNYNTKGDYCLESTEYTNTFYYFSICREFGSVLADLINSHVLFMQPAMMSDYILNGKLITNLPIPKKLPMSTQENIGYVRPVFYPVLLSLSPYKFVGGYREVTDKLSVAICNSHIKSYPRTDFSFAQGEKVQTSPKG